MGGVDIAANAPTPSHSLVVASMRHRLFVDTLRRALRANGEHGFHVLGDARYGRDALVGACERERPDVLLLAVDGASPSTAIDVVRRVKAASDETRIVLVLPSTADREALLLDYLEAGADGFLDRDATFEELIEGLRGAADGDLVVPEDDIVLALRKAARERAALRRGADMIGALTERELEILHHIVEGLGNDEIAARLHISARTVASHIQNLYRKLDVHSRLQAVAVARRYGIAAKDAV